LTTTKQPYVESWTFNLSFPLQLLISSAALILFCLIYFSPLVHLRSSHIHIWCLIKVPSLFFFPSLSFLPLTIASIIKASTSLFDSSIRIPFHCSSCFCTYFYSFVLIYIFIFIFVMSYLFFLHFSLLTPALGIPVISLCLRVHYSFVFIYIFIFIFIMSHLFFLHFSLLTPALGIPVISLSLRVHPVALLTYTIKLHGLSPLANYTDRATAACRRSDCQLLRIKGATWSP
jgi:hypothetical protein